MRKQFYMWIFFGASVVIVIGIWVFITIRTIGVSNNLSKKNPILNKKFKELEAKMNQFQTVGKMLFEQGSAEARQMLIHDLTLQKISAKLTNSASTTILNYEK